MPPKNKIDKQDVLTAAVSLIRTKGKESLNARTLAKALDCSTKPLFRIYVSMEELKKDVFKYADEYFGNYLITYQSDYDNPLLNVGLAYIDFAKNERNLFKLIYLSDNFTATSFEQFVFEDEGQDLFTRFQDVAQMEEEAAKKVYLQLHIYIHGIATLVATNNMEFPEKYIIEQLANVYSSFVEHAKNQKES